MNRNEIHATIEKSIQNLGLGPHLCEVKNVPSCVRVHALIGGHVVEFEARSGITEPELNEKIKTIEAAIERRAGGKQVDLEEAIASA